MTFSVVFVCTGNTCRSPMAEVIARRLFPPGVEVTSAGLSAAPGAPASVHARFVVADREPQQDLSGHRSRAVDAQTVANADLLVGMTRAHGDALRARVPDAEARILSLGEWAGEPDVDVPDPFGGELADYEATYDQIERLLEAVLPDLRARLRAPEDGSPEGGAGPARPADPE